MRFWIGVMVFFTMFINYMLRANMSVSIVDMVDRAAKNQTPSCTNDSDKNSTHAAVDVKRFNWGEAEVGYILAAYFWGYMMTIIPAGILSETLGSFHIILWSSVLSALLTGLTPLSTHGGVLGVMINRFCVGILGALPNPAVNVLIARWAPPKERGTFQAALMGNTVGTVVAFLGVGWTTNQWGWMWGFYFVVILVCVFCVAFYFLVSDTPAKSRYISENERALIEEAHAQFPARILVVPPYRAILMSLPFWALCFAHFGSLWANILVVTYTPKFFVEIIGFRLEVGAAVAALPFLARLICSNTFAYIGGKLHGKEPLMSPTIIRKIFLIISHFLPAVCFLLIRVTGCEKIAVATLLIMNQGFNGAVVVGHLINPQDLSPNFSGTVYGIQNFIGGTTGMFVPILTGLLSKQNFASAVLIYTIAGGVLALSGLLFILFGSAKVQKFNEIPEES